MKSASTVLLIIVSLFLAVSLVVSGFYVYFFIDNAFGDEKKAPDPEYAVFAAEGEISTEKFDIGACDSLRFFERLDDGGESRRTYFIGAMPDVTIVGDGENHIEVTANSDFLDVLEIKDADGVLSVGCAADAYNRVHEDDADYDYDYGLYVDCAVFTVVVHSPISSIYSDTNVKFDYEAPEAPKITLALGDEGALGVARNIKAEKLALDCGGKSEVKLQGEVSGAAELFIFHDTHIDAKDLSAGNFDCDVSRMIGGFSYVLTDKWYRCEFDVLGLTTLADVIVFGATALLILGEVSIIKKMKNKGVKD